MSFGVRSLLTPDKVSSQETSGAVVHLGPDCYSHAGPGNAWVELLSVTWCPTEAGIDNLNYRLLLSLGWPRGLSPKLGCSTPNLLWYPSTKVLLMCLLGAGRGSTGTGGIPLKVGS